MKFSPKKKAKMRKIRQRRINKTCKYMTGRCIDYENHYIVKDQGIIDNVMYLLVDIGENQYAIYKIVKLYEYVRLSDKKVLLNKKELSNHFNWDDHSTLEISEEGKILSVKTTEKVSQIKNNKIVHSWVLKN